VGDFNHDSPQDLVLTNFADNTVRVLLNGPDFAVMTTPGSAKMTSGSSTEFTVSMSLMNGFNDTVIELFGLAHSCFSTDVFTQPDLHQARDRGISHFESNCGNDRTYDLFR
jgi:hypothetical protein